MTTEERHDEALRQIFKRGNHVMVWMWRLGLGKLINLWPSRGGRIMIITHTGRKSGKKRYTPVNYTIVEGEIYCSAGFGPQSDWYQNIQVNPRIEVWLPNGWWSAVAEDVSDIPDRLVIMRQLLFASGFAAELFADINPGVVSDEELNARTRSCPLIRIHCTEARTGPNGPGEYVWVWPLAAIILLGLRLLRRKHG